MNISQPVKSQLEGVQFSYLSSDDIRKLSARQITDATTFDTLLNPVPGGLYSAELGQFGDNHCATCGLKNPQCPGHAGHIELPAPCYHPTFMDQILKLLRASCAFCGKLRTGRLLVTKFICKLQLVKYGLVKELRELDNLEYMDMKDSPAVAADLESEEDAEVSQDQKLLISRLERFVRDTIKDARRSGRLSTEKTETTNTVRQAIVKDFMLTITKSKKCHNCGAVNHKYRKDRFVKIFRKKLTEKEHAANVQTGVKTKHAVVEKMKQRQVSRKRKRDVDEAVADLGGSSEEEGDDVDMDDSSEGEPEIVGGDVVDGAAGEKRRSGPKDDTKDDYLSPITVYAQLEQLFERDAEVLGLVYGMETGKGARLSPDMFFVHTILVPPNRFRPEAKTGDNEIAEAQENSLYKNIINASDTIAEIQRELKARKLGQEVQSRYGRERTINDFENACLQLQESVNCLIDRNLSPLTGRAGARNPEGVKQKLEKKEGMFRKYMMGKRVNFAARTVISPDPNIETNEIGVPPVFAVKLTYPEPVSQHNVEELQEAVRNGPFKWPGAVAIESDTGAVIKLDRKNAEERTALANSLLAPGVSRGARPKKVHRHLNNGDIVIMNRQPTLHKPSMMCHRARVLPGEKTLRMHYANCNTYNADFDGDEMNMHFPQNELARAEALTVADTDHQYLSGTAGNPLRGLIQDHISQSVWLTNRDMFFEPGDYMNLLYAALRPENGHCSRGRLETLPPAILKPKPLWTGKQVISTVLQNLTPDNAQGLTMNGKSTTDKLMWGKEGKEEGEVIFQDGQLLQGILDKKQIGPAAGGFVNGVYEAYGHTIAGKLLSVLGRLLTKMLHMRAFSCGVEDLIFTREGEEARQKALAPAETLGLEIAAKYVSLTEQNPKSDDRELLRRLEDVLRDDKGKQHGLDQLTNQATNKQISTAVTNNTMPSGLIKPFPKNQMQTMTVSGAKGSRVNASQISCNLGQQVLEGRRVPVMVSGKTLPCFKPFESSVRAGGYIVDRFLTGVRPQEYFFHAMAGREGLIDTAVKTSRSGYLQRCIIKGMEGLKVEYDTSVRNSEDGSVVQFLYGEDGLDIAKSKYLDNFKFNSQNYLSLFQTLDMKDAFGDMISEEAKEHNKEAIKAVRKTGNLGASDPVLAHYSPSRHAGAISENIYSQAKKWLDENPDRVIRDKKKKIYDPNAISRKNFNHILDMRYMKAVVEPGEAVGVVAGQSIGEPSTQMTLNTFHLAGHAAKNVTLGIPRLREIVMTAAANIATPAMTLHLNEDISVDDARKFAKGLSKLSLAEIVDKVTVTETSGKGVAYGEAKKYEISLEFFSSEEYSKEYAITIDDVATTIEHRLLPRLQAATRKELKKRGDAKTLKAADDALPEVGKSAGKVEEERSRPEGEREGGDDDSDDEGDDDATRDKSKSNKQQAGYEAYEDEEEQDLRKKDATPDPIEDDEPPEDEAYGGSPRSSPEPDEQTEKKKPSSARERANRIKSSDKTNDIVSFSFDDKSGASCTFTMEYDSTTAKILMLHLVETALHQSLIQSVPGISSCVVDLEAMDSASKNPHNKGKTIAPILASSGVNIKAMWTYQHILNPNYIYTNSVVDMLRHYGVEAARNTIVREMQAVFGGHGISVDVRHLMLIADYMTRDGVYQAFSRMGYHNNPSPFMKMSFETTLNFLRDAVLSGDADDLKGPSARIVVGKINGVGTGGFDVFTPVGGERERERETIVIDDDAEEGSSDVEMVDG